MKSEKEVLDRVKRLCEAIVRLEPIIGVPDDSHIELSHLILNEIRNN